MKITSIISLGLSMTAAMASGDANLRANASSRQLRNSGQGSGGTWMYYLMLNALAAPADVLGIGACGKSQCNNSTSTSGSSSHRDLWESDGYSSSSWESDGHSSSSSSSSSKSSTSSSSSNCPPRCHAPHLHPPHPKPPKKPSSGGKKSDSSSGKNSSGKNSSSGSYTTNDDTNDDNAVAWGEDGYKSASSGNGDDGDNENSSGNSWYDDDAGNSGGGSDDGNSGDDAYGGSDDEARNSYLSNNNGNGGNAVQINSGKSMPVWPFLAAALVVGVVAAALIANRRKQARRGNHALNGSIKRRMELFSGGLPRKEKPAAESSLYENDYENEPSYVEMGGPEEQTPAAESSHYEMRDPDGR